MGDRLQAALAQAAAPGTLDGLYVAVKARVSSIVAAFDGLETKAENVTRVPQIFDGWLPPKDSASDLVFPFVLVRPSTGSDSEEGADQRADAKLVFMIGVYRDEDDGWRDLVRIIDAIRLDLGAAPAIDGTGFDHVGPLGWEIPDDQPRPEWFAKVTTNWILPRPRRVDARNPGEE